MEFGSDDAAIGELTDRLWRSGSVFADEELTALATAASTMDDLLSLVERRCAGERIEYLVGFTEFCGVRVRLRPGVFVPRPRTSWLVEQAARRLTTDDALLDLGCGSGAIALALRSRVPGLRITAVDADPVAVVCARDNLERSATVLQAWSPADLPGAPFDVITANLPYVPTAELALMPREAREHEPLLALDGGPDGLDPLRAAAPHARGALRAGGWILTEVAAAQSPIAEQILRVAGFEDVATHVHEDATVVVGRRSTPTPAPAG